MDNSSLTIPFIYYSLYSELSLTLIKTHMNKYSVTQRKGFTLLEILLVIAAIGILAAIVLVAINPNRQLAQARNAQRRSDVSVISSAISQRILNDAANNVAVSASINNALVDGTLYVVGTIATVSTANAVGTQTCAAFTTGSPTAMIDLTATNTNAAVVPDYVAGLPVDPSGGNAACTGYTVQQAATDGRVTVTAPKVEAISGVSQTISVTR